MLFRTIATTLLAGAAAFGMASGFSTAAQAQSAGKIKLCTSAGMNAAIQPVIYAQNKKLYEKHGLEIERIDLQDDTTAVQALIAQACDVLYAGAGTGMVAIARGADIKIVMSHTPWTDYVFVGQPDIKTLKDLVGKSVGTSKIGALNYQAAAYALRQEGVDPSSVQFLATGGNDSARAQALVAKTIKAAVMNGTWANTALNNSPDLHVVYDVGSVFREKFLSTAVFARGAIIKDRPQAVEAAVAALIEASRALWSDKAVAIDQAVSTGLKKDVMTTVYDNIFKSTKPYYGVNGGIEKPVVDSTVQILVEAGDMPSAVTFEKLVDKTFMDKALAKLGPYQKGS